MPVNLLPQTPPQAHAEARSACANDDSAPDTLTFAQNLAAASSAKGTKPAAHTQASGDVDTAADAQPAHALTDDELAALIAPSLNAPTTTIVPASIAKAIDDARPAAAVDPRAESSPDAAGLVSATLALLNAQPRATQTRQPLAGGAADRDNAITGVRPDARLAERSTTARLQADIAVPESAPAAAKPAALLATAQVVSDATRVLAEPKDARESRASPELTRSDVTTTTTITPLPEPVKLTIATPAFTPAWRDEVAQQLAQLVVMRQDRAEIRLHPADLGPITVQIQMEGGHANLLIQAPQPATRDGLELALPQLRDSLAQQGIMLGEASIRDQRQSDQQDAQQRASYSSGDDARAIPQEPAPILRARLGLVDLFA